jgi:hypothetical protein
VARAAGWHAGDLGVIFGPGMASIPVNVQPQRREHSLDGYVRCTKVIISFHFILFFRTPMALSNNQAIENNLENPIKRTLQQGCG